MLRRCERDRCGSYANQSGRWRGVNEEASKESLQNLGKHGHWPQQWPSHARCGLWPSNAYKDRQPKQQFAYSSIAKRQKGNPEQEALRLGRIKA